MISKYRRHGLAVLLILWLAGAACSLPIIATPAAPAATATATLAATIALTLAPTVSIQPTATHLPPAAPEAGEVLIYMVALEDNGASGPAIGCADSLIAVRRQIAPTRLPLTAALNELLAQKNQFYGESGFYNALWQSSLVVERAEVDAEGAATVTLTGQVRLSGTCDTPRFKAQIEQTILSSAGVTSAAVLLNGQPIDQALSQQ